MMTATLQACTLFEVSWYFWVDVGIDGEATALLGAPRRRFHRASKITSRTHPYVLLVLHASY